MSATKTTLNMTATKTRLAQTLTAALLANVTMVTLVMANPVAAKGMNSKTAHVEMSTNVPQLANTDILFTNAKPIPVHGASIPMALTTAHVLMALHSIIGRTSIQMRGAWTSMNADKQHDPMKYQDRDTVTPETFLMHTP